MEELDNPFGNLGQTAAQMWLLSCVFPFFGEQHAQGCANVWQVLVTMLQITAICLSKKISINIVAYLTGLVKEHLQLFKEALNTNITPKQHYLVHIPSQILKFGPSVRTWAMRFEAKHQQFKKIPKITKNFKNLPKTLTDGHQSGVRADMLSRCLEAHCQVMTTLFFEMIVMLGLVPPTPECLTYMTEMLLNVTLKASIQCLKRFLNQFIKYSQ